MKSATLLYIKNHKGEYLLMERLKDPNKGLMSPPGGKLDNELAETPVACAVREAFEECGLKTKESEWSLRGIVSEKDYPMIGSIMLFLMEYEIPVDKLPEPCNEGSFHFIHADEFDKFNIPVTDKLYLWENILKTRNNLFMMTLDCKNYPDIKQLNV